MRLPPSLRSDFLASVVVFLVALPLCMGIAIASGAPPSSGLVTGIIGGLVVGTIAGSPLQVSGPAAGLAVICYGLVQQVGLQGFTVVVLLAGAVQVVAGLLRTGRWFQAVPPAVIHGMLAGIGCVILLSQFHVMLDHAPASSALGNLLKIPEAVAKAIAPEENRVHHLAAGLGLLTLAVLVAWNTLTPVKLRVLPAALVAVVVATVAANVLRWPVAYVSLPANLLGELKGFSLETARTMLRPSTFGMALAVALIASTETLLCATAVDRMHTGPRTNYDRELLAQGVGNVLCGLVGGLPMTGVIVRSSANVQAGAKTRRSAILHGAWLLGLVALAPAVLRLIPISSLAAVLVFTGYKLVNVAVIRELRRVSRLELGIYVTTLVSIVVLDLLKGVAIGFALALARLLYSLTHLEVHLEKSDGTNVWTLSLVGSATFLRMPELTSALNRVESGAEVHIQIAGLRYLDHACMEALSSWVKQHESRGGRAVMDWAGIQARSRGAPQGGGQGA